MSGTKCRFIAVLVNDLSSFESRKPGPSPRSGIFDESRFFTGSGFFAKSCVDCTTFFDMALNVKLANRKEFIDNYSTALAGMVLVR
jgi:hypothetical protein